MDTRQKRHSVIGLAGPYTLAIPLPDSTIGLGDRYSLANLYPFYTAPIVLEATGSFVSTSQAAITAELYFSASAEVIFSHIVDFSKAILLTGTSAVFFSQTSTLRVSNYIDGSAIFLFNANANAIPNRNISAAGAVSFAESGYLGIYVLLLGSGSVTFSENGNMYLYTFRVHPDEKHLIHAEANYVIAADEPLYPRH